MNKLNYSTLAVLLLPWLAHTYSVPFLKRKDMVGIWRIRMKAKVNRPFPNPTDLYKDSLASANPGYYEEEVVVRLNDDGTFDPYTVEDDEEPQKLHHLLGTGGVWQYRDHDLLLAAHRKKNANPKTTKDLLFRGVPEAVATSVVERTGDAQVDSLLDLIDEDDGDPVDFQLKIPQGQISTGKFLYPPKHKRFFEEPVLFRSSTMGFFWMKQLLGKLNAINKPKLDITPKPLPQFHVSDFYNKNFYLLASEHPIAKESILEDKHCSTEEHPMWDVRVMEVTFFQNNTFAATGPGKTLRGEFGITGKRGTNLWFQVSIFGAGRSVSGSVFSEGKFVGQQDKRGYVGPITAQPNQSNDPIFHIHGDYFDGIPDLETSVPKQLSGGTFVLQEVNEECSVDFDYDDEDEEVVDEDDDTAFWTRLAAEVVEEEVDEDGDNDVDFWEDYSGPDRDGF